MDTRLTEWKLAVDRLWSAAAVDFRAAAQLAAEMTRGEDETLRAAAAQAMPSLRAACVKGADRGAVDRGRRRLGAIRDVLHALAAPRFGKRGSVSSETPEEHYRRMLGLPLGRRLFGPEINQAYKRAAKRAHPDAGGSERAFLELSKARDALMKAKPQ